MRKITIPVSAVLALSAIPMAQAATFTVDFSKVTDHAVDPSGKNNPGPLEVEGFTFAGGGKSGFNLKNGVGASYTIGGRTMDEGRTIYFTPKKSGRLTYNLTCTKDKNPEYYNAVTTEVADYFKNGKPTDDVIKSFIAFNTLGKKANGTFSVDLVGGQTYYIVVSEQHIVYSISYVEEAGPTKDVEVTVKKDKTEGTGSIVLNKGTYTLSAANGDLTVKIGNAVVAKDAPVIITENNTTVDLSVKLGDKATADIKVAVTAEISDVSLDPVKSVYTQKIAVMINKANVYTNDTRLQECAVQASSLMAEANKMGIDKYDEYTTTGKIASLDKKIADLSAKIDNAKAAYDGYVYAQGKYGNKYENGWVVDESNTTSLLAKRAELKEAYDNATKNVKDEAALAALETVYGNAVKALEEFKAAIDAEYAEGKQTDYAAYTSSIDTRVGSVKTDKVEASGVMGTLDEARKAIVNGDDNAISYANVNTAVNNAKASYTEEADKLYALLANNPTEKDGETYRNMYVEALGKLNNYLRIINEVKAENEEKYQAKECTKETQEAFIAKLAEVDNIGSVYTEYNTLATTLRTNYKNACSDINTNLTGYLKSQVKDVIGKKGGKDYTRKEVSEFYASQISAIETSITSIQNKVDDVNKKHIIGNGADATPYYADYVTEKAAVVAAIDALNLKVAASVREFDNWESSKKVVADLQAEFKLRKEGNKNDVTGVINTVSKDKVYSQATKFSAEYERTIQERINALLEAANASFAVEVKDGKTPAADFYKDIKENQTKDGKVTLYGSKAIAENIAGYAKAAADAMTKYEAVVAALASYDLALNGKDAVGKEGDKDYVAEVKGLKDVVTETGVTIDGTFEGKTYGAYIAEVEEKIGATKGLQKQLNDAVALNDTLHVNAMTALETFDDLVAEINSLKDSYATNAAAWNAVQLAHAKTSMLAEATRRVGVIDTKNVIKNDVYTDEYNTVVDKEQTHSNVTSFEEDTYGMWINDQTVKENDKDVKKEGLATLLKKCNDAVTAIQDKITSAEKSTDDAAAIAILSTVVTELEGAEAQYQSLSTLAEKVKTAYSEEKAARKELLVAIDGKDGLIDKLAKVTFTKNGADMFVTEKTNQSTAITKLKDDIATNFAAETVVANKQKLVDAKGNIDTAVKNLNDLVAKEQANKDANDAYTTAETETNITKAFTDAEAAIAKAVTDKKAVQGSDAYNYYVNTVLAGYRTENTTIATNRNTANTAVRKVYEKDNKTVLSGALNEAKYTDPAKNMTAKGESIKSDLETLKTNVGKVAQALIDCEAAYSTQTTKADDLDKLRAEVFNTITSAETSSYHNEALAKLQEIDKEIADYKAAKDAAYKKGTNETGKADIEAKANSAETKLTTLKTGWNDAYSKAVAADNEARKLEFDKAYTSLTQTYAQDVDLIARLSKLSYADEFGEDLKTVVGENGIYSYADKIRDLKTRTETAYSAVVAPTLFDGGEAFKAEAKTLETEIKNLTTGYTAKVNEAAEDKYDKESAKVTKSLSDAKTDVQTVLGAAFVTTDFLTEQFQDVQNIIDEAKGYTKKDEAGNFIKADFAEYLDNTILPSFATVDSKIAADKLAAAKTVYTNVLTEYRTLANSEATLIAGYHAVDGTLGLYSDDYKDFIEGSLDKAEELWAKIADADKYAKFNVAATGEKSVQSALLAFGTPDVHDDYDKDAKDQPAEWANKHTKKFWTAYDADQKYHANDIAYASMQTKIGDVQAELDKANEFVASLIIRNNSTILNRLSIAQGAIKNLKDDADRDHSANTAEENLAGFRTNCDAEIAIIKSIIEGKTTGATLVEENTAVEVQIGFLQHDYNQAAAVNIDNEKFDTEHYKNLIAGYSKKNADILRDFQTGKVDDKGLPILDEKKNVVYATAEETRQAFIALETEVGKMKSELTALYNEAAAAEAQAAVQAKIDELTATYDEFVAQLADCHAPVKKEYQPKVDAFKADIDALQAVLNAEAADNTVLLYQDENAKTASAIANSVATLSDEIANKEKPYDVNDAKYLELRGQLNTLTERLESVHNAIKEYEYKQEGDYSYDINGDGEISDDEKFSTYYEKRYAIVASYIAKDKEWLNGENEKYSLTSASTLSPKSQGDIEDYISYTERYCARHNALRTIGALQTALNAAKNNIDNLGYTDADRQNLTDTYTELNSKVVSLGNYNYAAYNNHVNSDIEGNPIKNEEGTVVGKDVVYMDEYPAIMEAAKALKADVATLAEDAVNKSWIKGDVDHNGKITVADYDAVRQMVLEQIKYTETDAMFYAADVNWDGLVNIGDVTMIGSNIMEGKAFPEGPAGTSSVAMAKGMAAGVPTYGNLALTAEGSGLAQTIRVAVDSRLGFVGGQFDVVLPKGVKLVSVASSSHDALMGEGDGAFRVLVSNLENTEIVNGQAFVELNVEVTSDYDGGGIEVRNVKFADADGTVFNLAKSSISTPTSLTNLTTTEKIQSKVYTVGGMLMNKVKKGINIIVNTDGTTKKQVIE